MVLNFYGVRVNQDQLAREVYNKNLRGSLNLELLLAGRRHGFDARTETGSIEKIIQAITEGVPVIVEIKPSPKKDLYHFMVVYGFNRQEKTLTVNSGRDKQKTVSWGHFNRVWKATGNWMLLITQRTSWP